MSKISHGGAMAAMVAGLFAMTAASGAFAAEHGSKGDQAEVKCTNSSSCKGHGSCKQASNACKGKNACKGQGFTLQKSQQDCAKAQTEARA